MSIGKFDREEEMMNSMFEQKKTKICAPIRAASNYELDKMKGYSQIEFQGEDGTDVPMEVIHKLMKGSTIY